MVHEKDIPKWKLSPNRASIGSSQIAFPIAVLPENDHTDYFQLERLDLPYWTMILAICVGVDESKCLDIPILGIFNNLWASSISLGYKQILRPLLVLSILAVCKWYPWLLLLSFEKLMILVRWILRKTLSRLLKYHLGVQLDLCTFGSLPPIQHFSDDICPLMMQNEL